MHKSILSILLILIFLNLASAKHNPEFINRENMERKIDCPAEYYDITPKYYNCPREDYEKYPIQNPDTRLYYESPVHIASDEVYGEVIKLDEHYTNKKQNQINFKLIIALVVLNLLLVLLIISALSIKNRNN